MFYYSYFVCTLLGFKLKLKRAFQWTIVRSSMGECVVCAVGTKEVLCRPCVDCGLVTGNFCDWCKGEDRLPEEYWAPGQMTPLCTHCDKKRNACHFCRGEIWCVPPRHTAAAAWRHEHLVFLTLFLVHSVVVSEFIDTSWFRSQTMRICSVSLCCGQFLSPVWPFFFLSAI